MLKIFIVLGKYFWGPDPPVPNYTIQIKLSGQGSMSAPFKCVLCRPGLSILWGAFTDSKCCAGRQLKIL